ncbi:copper homeostasis membrane protein CopD [Rhizobium sp. 2YAF20]|uniref:copper homeostasis membrane protein CopD n=1 Tax=Rhizobium sp. 2YAF20 TaxID=3233027 RepID=UPI003F948D42
MIDLQTALEACRFFHNASLMLLWGTSAFLCLLVPGRLAAAAWHALGRMPVVAAVIAIGTTVLFLPLEAGTIGDGWGNTIDPGTIRDVLLETTVGQAWLAQTAAAVILALAFALPSQKRMASIAFGSALCLAFLVLTGHASMYQGWLRLLHRSNDVIHVLASGAWIGALVALLPILKHFDSDDFRADAQIALRRFSNAGHGAVMLVIGSGIANTFLVLQRLPTDWSSPYQAMLAAKIALVVSMVTLAVINRYVFVPSIGKTPTRTSNIIRLACIAEIALGFTVLVLVAVLGLIEPA